jgi:hypothetical protein
MKPGRVTTAEILAHRALEMTCGQECVDWAVGLLIDGRDSMCLRRLAGAEAPHNHFELATLRDGTLEELGVEAVSREAALTGYARERLRAAIAGTADLTTEIEVVSQLCSGRDDVPLLVEFYLLHNAYADLQTSDLQWYWPEANRSNILAIMRQRAERFVSNESQDSD